MSPDLTRAFLQWGDVWTLGYSFMIRWSSEPGRVHEFEAVLPTISVGPVVLMAAAQATWKSENGVRTPTRKERHGNERARVEGKFTNLNVEYLLRLISSSPDQSLQGSRGRGTVIHFHCGRKSQAGTNLKSTLWDAVAPKSAHAVSQCGDIDC